MNRKRQSILTRAVLAAGLALLCTCVFTLVAPVIAVTVSTLWEQFMGNSGSPKPQGKDIFLSGVFLLGTTMLIFTIPAAAFSTVIWVPLWLSRENHPIFSRKRLALPIGAVGGLLAWLGWMALWHFFGAEPEPGAGHQFPDPRAWSDRMLVGAIVGGTVAGGFIAFLSVSFANSARGKVLMEIPPGATVVSTGKTKDAPLVGPPAVAPPAATPQPVATPAPPVTSSPKKSPPATGKARPGKKPSWTDWGQSGNPPQ